MSQTIGQPLPGSIERFDGLSMHPGHALAGWGLNSQLMCLAGPEIDHVTIALPTAVGTEWGGQVVDLGIGYGRLQLVLTHETVHDPAREAAAEHTRERG